MNATDSTSRTQSIALCGLSIALLAVSAFITVPLGPIPFTLQTAALVLIILVLTPGEAMAAVGGYLVLGGLGMPIFSGMRGGLGVLAGPTGGFLIGFLVGTAVASLIRMFFMHKVQNDGAHAIRWRLTGDIAAGVTLVLISYAIGVIQYNLLMQSGIAAALIVCVVPFIIPDAVKVGVAIICARPVRAALGRGVTRLQSQRAEERE